MGRAGGEGGGVRSAASAGAAGALVLQADPVLPEMPLDVPLSQGAPSEVRIDAFIPAGSSVPLADLVPPAELAPLEFRLSPVVLQLAALYDIPPDRIEVLFSGAERMATEEKIGQLVRERLTPERVVDWLASPDGQAWAAVNPQAYVSTLRQRAATGVPSLALGVLSIIGAEELADIIGLDPVHHAEERFFFVVSAMHGANSAGSAIGRSAAEIAMNRFAGRPFDFMRQVIVHEGESATLRVVFEARSSFSRALAASLMSNFAAEGGAVRALANGARGIVMLPFRMVPAIGPGLASSRIVDATVGELLPKGSAARTALSFGAFFLPDAVRLVASRRAMQAIQGIPGLRLLGRAFAVGFVFDMGTMLTQRAALGDGAPYFRSVIARVSDRKFQHDGYEDAKAINDMPWYGQIFAYPAAFTVYVVREGVDFVTPATMDMVRSMDAMSQGLPYLEEVYREDDDVSRGIQRELPRQILAALVQGIGGERDDSAFYRAVDLSRFEDGIALDGTDEEIAERIDGLLKKEGVGAWGEASRQSTIEALIARYTPAEQESGLRGYGARHLQETLSSLVFIHRSVNDRVREAVDDEGHLREGREGEFLRLALPDVADAETARAHVLDARRASLILRTLEADGEERARLLGIAAQAGLADGGGTWFARTPLYFESIGAWAMAAASDPARKARAMDRVDALLREMLVTEGEQKTALAQEIVVVTTALEAGGKRPVDAAPAIAQVPSGEDAPVVTEEITDAGAAAAFGFDSKMISGLLDLSGGTDAPAAAFDASGGQLLQGSGASGIAPLGGVGTLPTFGVMPAVTAAPAAQPAMAR